MVEYIRYIDMFSSWQYEFNGTRSSCIVLGF